MAVWRLQTTVQHVQHWLTRVTRVTRVARGPALSEWLALAGEARLESWEAELTAYARWRTANPALKVRFGLATGTTWGEEVVLARPGRRLAPEAALAQAECELEHLLAHHRYGWRELALLWQVWAEPSAAIVLPWAPWDAVPLPPGVVRQALAAAHPALRFPPGWEGAGARQRGAAVWLAGAWADGRHRALAVAERPGLAQRLPLPGGGGAGGAVGRRAGAPGEPGGLGGRMWLSCPGCRGRRRGPRCRGSGTGGAEGDVGRAVERLLGVETQDVGAQVEGVLDLVEALWRRGALPPAHKQRPPWLRRPWGRWRREAALREALDRLARSPTSAAVAVATAAGRRRGGPGVGRRGGPGGTPGAARGGPGASRGGGRRARAGGGPAGRPGGAPPV